jgi:hypothetical protein
MPLLKFSCPKCCGDTPFGNKDRVGN